jgi:hypothetical protein
MTVDGDVSTDMFTSTQGFKMLKSDLKNIGVNGAHTSGSSTEFVAKRSLLDGRASEGCLLQGPPSESKKTK